MFACLHIFSQVLWHYFSVKNIFSVISLILVLQTQAALMLDSGRLVVLKQRKTTKINENTEKIFLTKK